MKPILYAALLVACKGPSERAAPIVTGPATANVAHEQVAHGDVRLYSGTIADLDGDGTLELAAGGFTTAGDRRRATVFIYRQDGTEWKPVTDGGWLGGGGGNGSTVRNVEVADLDGDGRPEIIALGRVGSKMKAASARLVVLTLQGGELRELAKTEWNVASYTHGYGLAIADLDGDKRPEIVTTGFLFDGTTEHGFVRTWSFADGLTQRAEKRLDGTPAESVRINDVAIADIDGDGRPEIVTAGRTGPYLPDGSNDDLDARREVGDIAVFDNTLALVARKSWRAGSSLRLRTVAIADLDGGAREIIVGGQFDAIGKQMLGVFALRDRTLELRTHVAGEGAGEIKDVLVAGQRIIATGPAGTKGARQGDVSTWKLDGSTLRQEQELVSSNGIETRARAAVIGPDGNVLTIGHAKTSSPADGRMVGQLLTWPVAAAAK